MVGFELDMVEYFEIWSFFLSYGRIFQVMVVFFDIWSNSDRYGGLSQFNP